MKYERMAIEDALKSCRAAELKLEARQRARKESWLLEWVETQNSKWWRRLLRLASVGIREAEKYAKTVSSDPVLDLKAAAQLLSIDAMGADTRAAIRRIRDTVMFLQLLEPQQEDILVLRTDLEALS